MLVTYPGVKRGPYTSVPKTLRTTNFWGCTPPRNDPKGRRRDLRKANLYRTRGAQKSPGKDPGPTRLVEVLGPDSPPRAAGCGRGVRFRGRGCWL